MNIKLTHREITILRELIKGKSYKEISQTLYISVATVKFYMGQISEKLGVKGRLNILLSIFNNEDVLKTIKEYDQVNY